MHSTKPDFKKMTEAERKEFLKEFKKSVARTTTGNKKKPVKYLEFNKTARPMPMAATMNDAVVEKSLKKYHEHIQSMVALGFSNPTDPSFRNDVVKNMKELYNANPKNVIPMHDKEWVVNSIVQKVYQNVNKNKANKPTQKTTTVKIQDAKKTKQMFEARRKALAAKKRKQQAAAAVSNNNHSNNNNNGREGFNMNNMSNNNNSGSKSNSNNNNDRNSNSNHDNVRSMTKDDVKKLMNNLKRLNMSVVRV